jgi:hypothetical protein
MRYPKASQRAPIQSTSSTCGASSTGYGAPAPRAWRTH